MAVSNKVKGFMEQGSWIRKMFEEGISLKQQFGEENVFDLSLGNPIMEPPQEFFDELRRVAENPIAGLHRYMPNAGFVETRDAVAAQLREETGQDFTANEIIMCCGAGGALNVILKTLLDPGDEVVIFAPYFVEYFFYADNHGGACKVVPPNDNYFACLNSAVFSDGTFVYIPEGTRCPMELSTYFRINAENTGQFERTLIVAEKGSYVSYLEGCTAPMRDENQLHAAVVELVAMDDAEIKYSTVQNWYPGNSEGVGGIYNFVTKRGLCQGARSKISWTQVETGSAVTWKYPSCVLNGENSVGEFYSVAVTNNHQQADTGTKMIHNGKGSRSTIISKGISAGQSNNTYRGLVRVAANAEGVRNRTECDSLLLGDRCGAHTVPYIEVKNPTAQIEHEATTSKISDDQLFYAQQRGLDEEAAIALIVNGFAKEVLKELPMEFAVEAQKLLAISLEGSVG